MIVALLLGFFCGFIGSIPIAGPIAVLVFERGLDGKFREGFSIAVGAAFAESCYAGAAYLGMTAMFGKVPWMLAASRLLGAIILFAIGLYFALRKDRAKKDHAAESAEKKRAGHGAVVFGFLLCIVNPTLIFTWGGIVGILHGYVHLAADLLDAVPFGLGAFSGIVAWFGTLLFLLRKFRDRLKESTLNKIVRAIGWVLVVVGIGLGIKIALSWKL